MKIALVIEKFDPARGGRETSTAQIAAGLVRRGNDVTILCHSGESGRKDVTVKKFPPRGILRVQRLSNFLSDVRTATGEVDYDIVHAMLPAPGANVYQPRGGTIPGQIA
ncbi:MAG: glycosyltransferase, partial [Planctomycetota bacterium]